MGHARQHGLISQNRGGRIVEKKEAVDHWAAKLESTRADGGSTFGELIRRGEARALPTEFESASPEVRDEVLYRVRYQGYLARELRHVQKVKQLENMRIPSEFNYTALRGLRRESVAKLVDIKPITLGQASRISGVSPADISILMVSIEAGRDQSA